MGKEVPRVKVSKEDLNIQTNKCDGCGMGMGSYHVLACVSEYIDCPKHGRIRFLECPCEGYEEEVIKQKEM